MDDFSSSIRIHNDFKKTIDNFIKDFEKINGIKLSYCDASIIINEKIKKAGGLIIE
jgi:hypothetical protein